MRIAVAGDDDALPADLLALLAAAGLPTASLAELPDCGVGPGLVAADGVEWLVASGADVLAICACGAAEAGIVGKDMILEYTSPVCQLVDLGAARGRLVHAVPREARRPSRQRTRVATRYPAVTRRSFAAQGRDVDSLVMRSPALAVELGIADGVVDLERRLPSDHDDWVIVSELASCSARLVAGRQARTLHGGALAELIDRLREAKKGS